MGQFAFSLDGDWHRANSDFKESPRGLFLIPAHFVYGLIANHARTIVSTFGLAWPCARRIDVHTP
jgi:hypothetical protein